MKARLIWVSVAGAAAALPAHAVTYLTIEQAQQAIFPGATLTNHPVTLTREQRKAVESTSGVKVRSPDLKVWYVEGGGWMFIDEVIGKHEFITFAVGLNADGSVKQIEVMDYRENYGAEIRRSEWRSQFTGKKYGDPLNLKADIRNISGATMSCQHLTEGVKRLLAVYELVLKQPA